MHVLIDSDVILDVILVRTSFGKDSGEVLDLCEQGLFEGLLSSITPINIFYIARKSTGGSSVKKSLEELFKVVRVCAVNHTILTSALALPFSDYKDAVRYECAVVNNLDAIVTHNLPDYKNATLPVYAPTNFLNHIQSSSN